VIKIDQLHRIIFAGGSSRLMSFNHSTTGEVP